MVNLKKNVLTIIAIMLISLAVILPTNAYASTIQVITPNTTPSPVTTSTPSSIRTTPSPSTVSTPKATATPKTQTKLPQTGIEDNYIVLIGVTLVLGASAVFAYKKMKEYNKF